MAIYTKIKLLDLKKILAPYQIEISNFTPIKAGNANSNYYLQSKKDEFILTIAEESSLQEIKNLTSLLSWLKIHHFTTSEVEISLNGQTVTEYKKKPVLIKRWIHGEVKETFNEIQLESIGYLTGRLHQIPAPNYLPRQHSYGLQFFLTVVGKNIDIEYENWLTEQVKFFENNLPKNLPTGLIHGDIFFDNVLFENEVLKAMIDFQEACHYYLVFDLGMSILGLCQNNEKIDLNKAKALIKGYEKIRSLVFLEKKSLPLFIRYAAVATSCWRFWKYNIYSSTPSLKYEYKKMVKIANNVSKIYLDYFI